MEPRPGSAERCPTPPPHTPRPGHWAPGGPGEAVLPGPCALAVWREVSAASGWTLRGPETVTQAAIVCLFLRIAKVREDFSTGRIRQVSTEMFLKSFFVLSQNTEAELFH